MNNSLLNNFNEDSERAETVIKHGDDEDIELIRLDFTQVILIDLILCVMVPVLNKMFMIVYRKRALKNYEYKNPIK